MKKSTVVIFVLVKENKILIERRPIKGYLEHQVLIPGGTVNSHLLEKNEDALKRELMEELGIIPLEYELITDEDIPGLRHSILKPFIIKSWQGDIPEIGLDKEESYPLEWMEIDQVLEVPIIPTRKIIEHLKKYLSK